jgi:hypothetical protein
VFMTWLNMCKRCGGRDWPFFLISDLLRAITDSVFVSECIGIRE